MPQDQRKRCFKLTATGRKDTHHLEQVYRALRKKDIILSINCSYKTGDPAY